MATFLKKIRAMLLLLLKRTKLTLLLFLVVLAVIIGLGKTYQSWDDDPDRGAAAMSQGAFGENYPTPIYLPQGWSASDSLWFYNTTQGSALIPYDFFLALEQEHSQQLLRANEVVDQYRYLAQKPTFFNPDGLPVGFTKETYQGRDYMGFTCAACHTSQVNYTDDSGKTTAIRIDGGPAMADMVGYLHALGKSMRKTLDDSDKKQRFIDRVIAFDNDYSTPQQVTEDLVRWRNTIELYNTVNHSHIKYGYARLDAFGRIYNRVLQHIIDKPMLANAMRLVTRHPNSDQRILTDEQIDRVLDGVDENIIVDSQFGTIIERLTSTENGYPGLSLKNLLRIRNAVFNEPNAPVSYPFLWDITHSDYVQWNGLANNSGVGPLGRNAGEVIGVFAILDWTAHKRKGFSLAAYLTGQKNKDKVIDFKSSVDLTNLKRLESHLKSLQSPPWPAHIFGQLDQEKVKRGQLIYAKYCESCHQVVDPSNWGRIVVAKMSGLDFIGTDKAMATNSVSYTGKSGNLKHTVQSTDVGSLLLEENAPVVQILTSATKGVIATPDADKSFIRRWADSIYTIVGAFFDNEIPNTIKNGNYLPDTTANPYNSLLAYKGRSLNGIWATAPYLHNGSVPSLYDLLLPKKRDDDPDTGEYRPDNFMVGSREFDSKKVGFRTTGYEGFEFKTTRLGDYNTGHEYGAGRTPQLDGTQLPALNKAQRYDLIEYLKSL